MKHPKMYMKQFALILVVVTTLLTGCKTDEHPLLPPSTGKMNEILLVMDTVYWSGIAGESIQNCFNQIQHGLPQEEVYFKLVRIPHKAFGSIFKTTRNIVFINIDKKLKPSAGITRNKWATDQLILTVNGPGTPEIEQQFKENKDKFMYLFRNEEVNRLVKKYRSTEDEKMSELVKGKFGFKLSVPPLYQLAKEGDNFLWLRKDKNIGEHPVIQSMLIYTFPYTDTSLTTTNILLQRNKMTKKYVPGGIEGSYQKCYEEYPVVVSEISLDSLYTKEIRGLWNMHKEFMGGPFVNYGIVSPDATKVICIDIFCFAPYFDKRNFLFELEGIVKTFRQH